MLREAFETDKCRVYVYGKKRSGFKVAIDFELENLFFVVLENELWEVGCLEKGKFLMFDGLELIKIE
jgi:hypothetical protein